MQAWNGLGLCICLNIWSKINHASGKLPTAPSNLLTCCQLGYLQLCVSVKYCFTGLYSDIFWEKITRSTCAPKLEHVGTQKCRSTIKNIGGNKARILFFFLGARVLPNKNSRSYSKIFRRIRVKWWHCRATAIATLWVYWDGGDESIRGQSLTHYGAVYRMKVVGNWLSRPGHWTPQRRQLDDSHYCANVWKGETKCRKAIHLVNENTLEPLEIHKNDMHMMKTYHSSFDCWF